MSKSRITLEPSEIDEDANRVTEVMLTIDREDEDDPELREQMILMTPSEFERLCWAVKVQTEQGTWTTGTIDR